MWVLEAALYWNVKDGNLAELIEKADKMNDEEIASFGRRAKERVKKEYTWEKISDEYERLFLKDR